MEYLKIFGLSFPVCSRCLISFSQLQEYSPRTLPCNLEQYHDIKLSIQENCNNEHSSILKAEKVSYTVLLALSRLPDVNMEFLHKPDELYNLRLSFYKDIMN